MDGYDYFCVSLTVKLLAEQFETDTQHITTAITLTLLFRSLGALIFGVLADRFGRKWTLVGNLLLIAIFELASGFCNTYSQFLAVRSLFGVAMGGIWGQAGEPLILVFSSHPMHDTSLSIIQQLRPLLKTFPLLREVSALVSCNKAMPPGTSLPPASIWPCQA